MRKRIMITLLVSILTLTLPVSAMIVSNEENNINAKINENELASKYIELSEYKIEYLQASGLTTEEINKLTLKELRELLTLSESLDEVKLFGQAAVDNAISEDRIVIEKILSNNNIDKTSLTQLESAYHINELLNMDESSLKSALKDTESKLLNNKDLIEDSNFMYDNQLSSKSPNFLPSGHLHFPYKCELGDASCNVPDHFLCTSGAVGDHESFYYKALEFDTINEVAASARELSERITHLDKNSVASTYYLWGEWYGDSKPSWAHEGVDLQEVNKNNLHAYNPMDHDNGVVVWTGSTTINIYDAALNITITFQHVSHSFKVGDTLDAYQYIGEQSGDNHIHVGVILGKCEKKPWDGSLTGKDLILSTTKPYSYINFYTKY